MELLTWHFWLRKNSIIKLFIYLNLLLPVIYFSEAKCSQHYKIPKKIWIIVILVKNLLWGLKLITNSSSMSHNPNSEKISYYFCSKIKNLQMQEPFILSMRLKQESTYHNGLTSFLKEHASLFTFLSQNTKRKYSLLFYWHLLLLKSVKIGLKCGMKRVQRENFVIWRISGELLKNHFNPLWRIT